jgi:hypothetical protein
MTILPRPLANDVRRRPAVRLLVDVDEMTIF